MKKLLICLLTIVSVFFSFSACGFVSDDGPDGSDPSQTIKAYKSAGTYQAGVDIDAAEYLLVCSGSASGYMQVTLTKNASVLSSDFLYNETFGSRRYVKVNTGEFLQFSGSKLYKLDSTPAIAKASDNGYPAGQYKVGRDIEAGEYLIVDSAKNSLNYIEQLAAPNAKTTSSDFLFNELFTYRHYVKVSDGQYISFSYGKLYDLDDAPEPQLSNNNYQPGQYKAGADIPAGTHKIKVTEGTSVYYEITTLPLCSVMSDAFIQNANLTSDTSITVTEGQYLLFKGGQLELSPQE